MTRTIHGESISGTLHANTVTCWIKSYKHIADFLELQQQER